jgi:small acid-soluble spore protein H (minor)
MDIKRAKEIINSPIMANVSYEGNLIYIDSINDNSKTASIHLLNQPGSEQEVPVASLTEG